MPHYRRHGSRQCAAVSYCPLCRSWEHEGGTLGGDPWGSKVRVAQQQLVEQVEQAERVGLARPPWGWEDQGPAPCSL